MAKNKSKKQEKKMRAEQNTEMTETSADIDHPESTGEPRAKMKRKEFDK